MKTAMILYTVLPFLIQIKSEPILQTKCNDILEGKLGTPSPIEVNECQTMRAREQCDFDVSGCGECLMGYETDDSGCPKSCLCATNGLVEGDIKFEEKDVSLFFDTYDALKERDENPQEAADSHVNLWNYKNDGEKIGVPYVINLSSKRGIDAIENAIKLYTENTCIRFVQRTNERNFISFKDKGGCWSYVGMRGGSQDISIGKNCEYTGLVQHEILHALGFWHEQSRPDRDRHIVVQYENIREDKKHNFNTRSNIDSLGSPYDKESIMHYSGYAFSTNGLPTIIDVANNQPIHAQRDGLSKLDLEQLNKLYKCPGSSDQSLSWAEWTNWSSCSVTCGSGSRQRTRKCLLQSEYETTGCRGMRIEQVECILDKCNDVGYWTNWDEWRQCTRTCDSGYQIRGRVCKNGKAGKPNCFGSAWEGRTCNHSPCGLKDDLFSFNEVVDSTFCKYGDTYTGDFNGDGKSDLLCSYYGGWIQTALGNRQLTFNEVAWEGSTNFGNPSSNSQGLVGDFNCDKSDDLLWFNKAESKFSTHYSNLGKFETEADWESIEKGFCNEDESKLLSRDINGDGCSDLLCISDNGRVSVIKLNFQQ